PTTVMGAFVAPTSTYIGESTDRAAAYWAAAQDTCFMAGGHVPRATELAELISQGLPGGTNTWLWTAGEVGVEPTNGQFLNAVMKWTNLDRRFSYANDGTAASTASWNWKYMMWAYRCVYFPIDLSYPTPTCFAGCFTVTQPGTPAPTMWLDSQDRAGATLGTA